jgi:uncharacterized alkaline shock family protein YloU
MSTESDNQGHIQISLHAIASIASKSALQSYGVVGMAAPNLVYNLTAAILRDPNKGVEVKIEDGEVSIDIYIIVEYGTRISTVTNSLINAVRFNVERSISAPVKSINVYVQGLRITNPDDA